MPNPCLPGPPHPLWPQVYMEQEFRRQRELVVKENRDHEDRCDAVLIHITQSKASRQTVRAAPRRVARFLSFDDN